MIRQLEEARRNKLSFLPVTAITIIFAYFLTFCMNDAFAAVTINVEQEFYVGKYSVRIDSITRKKLVVDSPYEGTSEIKFSIIDTKNNIVSSFNGNITAKSSKGRIGF